MDCCCFLTCFLQFFTIANGRNVSFYCSKLYHRNIWELYSHTQHTHSHNTHTTHTHSAEPSWHSPLAFTCFPRSGRGEGVENKDKIQQSEREGLLYAVELDLLRGLCMRREGLCSGLQYQGVLIPTV